jgi:hypothetical protein
MPHFTVIRVAETGMLKAIRRLQQVHYAVLRPTYGDVEADIPLMFQPWRSRKKAICRA